MHGEFSFLRVVTGIVTVLLFDKDDGSWTACYTFFGKLCVGADDLRSGNYRERWIVCGLYWSDPGVIHRH